MADFFSATFLIQASAVCAVLTMVAVQVSVRCFGSCIQRQAWWPKARRLQKATLMNGGRSEESCTEKLVLETYSWVVFICIHHFLAGIIMLPVVFSGWEEAGTFGQQLFAFGGILCIGFDVEDLFATVLIFFFPSTFACLGEAGSLGGLILCIFHHALSISMFLPILIIKPEARPFHYISCSLLLAAGIAYGLGCYKFTLDTKEAGPFRKYKIVVVVQFLTIWYTRCFIWFPSAYSMLVLFYNDPAEGARTLFPIGCVVVGTMSVFNIFLLIDCTIAAVKWLPRQRPTTNTEKAELANTMAHSAAAQIGYSFGNIEQAASDRGFMKQSAAIAELEQELAAEEKENGGNVIELS